ncbi:NERD domain-containing protein [Nocardioides ochotonae]|uniref:NERD domain-containing protein n=1 Tax=Nocardioides ochotonae TaxID=2685869 RepID=UPI001A9F8FC0
MTSRDLVVNRWRRFGMDRLYVETADGEKIGFWDLVAETAHPESPEGEPDLLAAVAGWKAQAQSGKGPTVVDALPEGTAVAQPEPEPELQHEAMASTLLTQKDGGVDGAGDAGAPVELVGPVARDVPVEPVRPWVDLATNRPGAEAREQALSARDAAPVKTILARVLGVHTDERAWRIGADGEEKVAAELAKVARKDPRWRFLHAIPVGSRGSDIDHLVIGPGGVFTANAKHHPGAKIWVGGSTFMVNGVKQPYVRNARHEAQRAAKLLAEACGFPVHVEGLIVAVNADDVTIKSQPEGVSVVPRMRVAKWLLRHGPIHSPETIDAIYEVARRSTTWR